MRCIESWAALVRPIRGVAEGVPAMITAIDWGKDSRSDVVIYHHDPVRGLMEICSETLRVGNTYIGQIPSWWLRTQLHVLMPNRGKGSHRKLRLNRMRRGELA